MESGQQSDYETYHAIALGRNGTDLIVVATDAGFRLPSVEVPRRQRVAENLTAGMRSKWGCEVICLFRPNIAIEESDSKDGQYEVVELWHLAEKQDAQTVCVPVCSLSQESFAHATDYRVIQESLAQCAAAACGPAAGPFATIGWFERLREWVEGAIHPLKLRANDSFRQFNASPSFSLIRFETSGPAFWFKAVGAPNLREFSITLTLVQLFPSYVPHVFATRPEWNGWLAHEIQGVNLGDSHDTKQWMAAAASLAHLQIDSIGKQSQLLDSGARDFRVPALLDTVVPLLDVMAQLMAEQIKVPPAPLTREEVVALRDPIYGALLEIQELPIPEGLGHLDINPGNVIVSPSSCRFLDWTEAYVGHPFYSFEHLLEHFRRAVQRSWESEALLKASYAGPWRKFFASDDIATGMALAPLLAVFTYAAGYDAWKDERQLQDPKVAGYLRSLARRLKHEAGQLVHKKSAYQSVSA